MADLRRRFEKAQVEITTLSSKPANDDVQLRYVETVERLLGQ